METVVVEQDSGTRNPGEVRRETYTLRQFSALSGIGLTAIRRGIRENDLPVMPVRIGGQWLFPRRPVDRLLGLDAE